MGIESQQLGFGFKFLYKQLQSKRFLIVGDPCPMTSFQLYEKRRYRRIAPQDNEGVYCIISGFAGTNKAFTVPAVEFSQEGFQFFFLSPKNVDFTEYQKLSLKAIAGSRNLTFSEPIDFEIKWQNIDIKNNRTYVGCQINKMASTAEEQFISFIEKEFKFAAQWVQDQQSDPIRHVHVVPKIGASVDSSTRHDDRFESIFNNSHIVMLLIDPENADIVDANPAAVAFYGWSYESLIAKKITDINTLPSKTFFQNIKKAKAVHRHPFCFQHRLANGDIRHVEVFSGPVMCNGRQLLYSIIHDVSDRKKAEAERE